MVTTQLNPISAYTREEHNRFAKYVDVALQSPPIAEGTVFSSLFLLIDGCPGFQLSADMNETIQSLPDDWETLELWGDDELLYAQARDTGLVCDRLPENYQFSF